MKIGIITLPLHANYGGILQNYALQTVLKKKGWDVETIELRKEFSEPNLLKSPLTLLKRLVKKYILKWNCHIRQERYENLIKPIICKNTIEFIKNNINLRRIDNYSDLSENDYDALVVGSDQVWRPIYFTDGIYHAYLDFAKGWNIRKLAYAISFGTKEWEYTVEQTESCKNYIKDFDAVGFRESEGDALSKKYLHRKGARVLDPTLLLDKEDYLKLISDKYIGKKFIFTYILNDNINAIDIINKVSKVEKLEIVNGNSKYEQPYAKLVERIQPPIEDWLAGILRAKYVITDSFHATVISLIFHKEVLVLENPQRGLSRLISLFSIFDIHGRLISSFEDFKASPKINYEKFEDILAVEREFSSSFLFDNLRNQQ